METSFFSFALALLILNSFNLISSTSFSNFTTDHQALLAFKNAITSDPRGILAKSWSGNTSICSWVGVNCSIEHHRVTALDVSSFDLGGTIPPHLGNLTFLQYLDISSNSFTGLIPSELSNLRRLTVIDVGFNNFTGGIPSWFGALSELQHIRLNNNTFSGTIPLSLFNISKLQTLDIRYNSVDGNIPEEIGNFSFLETVHLGDNQFTGSIPNGFFNISSLIEINIRRNRLSDKLPEDICGGYSPKLEKINLSRNELNGEIPANIHKCRELQELRLSQNNFNGSIPSEIGSLTMLRILSLHSNNFTGGIPAQIWSLSQLEELYLSSNHLTGSIPKQIGNLTSLKTLELAHNKLTGELPQELGNLAYLEIFAVPFNNHLSGPIPSSMFNVSTLKPNNVLLDEDMVAHVGDFGIAKLFDEGEAIIQTKTFATIGYAAPEYGSEGRVSTSGDVYSYGIMLLEMFTQKKPTDDMFNGEMSLKEWVSEALQGNAIGQIVAPGLLPREDQHFSKKEQCVSSIFDLAMKCLAFSPKERIDMIQLGTVLQKIKAKVTAER